MRQNRKKFSIPFIWFLLILVSISAPPLAGAADNQSTQWAAAGFGNPKIKFVDPKPLYKKTDFAFTHYLDLTLVQFRDTGWTEKIILKRLKKVAHTYGRYGIQLRNIKLVLADAPNNMIDFLRPGIRDQQIAERLPETQYPVLFFIRSIPKFNAYAWIQHSDNDEIPEKIKNTAWFSLSVTMELNLKIRHPNYVSESHELGHLLLDTLEHPPHGSKNLMAEDPDHVNDELTPRQVEKIKANPLVFPIKKQ